LVLSGWATSTRGIAGVAVQIDERQWNASYGLDTPELAGKPQSPSNTERAGYRLRIDTSAWAPGPYYVTVAAFDLDGGRSAIEGSVEIRPFEPPSRTPQENLARIEAGKVALSLDMPKILEGPHEVSEPVEILGWAHAEDGIEAVIVTIDGHHQHEALRPIARPDLLADYGPKVASDAGFVSRLHSSECGHGPHSLTVVALGQNGEAVGIAGEIVCPESADAENTVVRVAWQEGLEKPRRRDSVRDPQRAECAWEDRALLAEASAAEARAEARLIYMHQRGFASRWRKLEAKVRDYDTIRDQLAQRSAELEVVRAELKQSQAELDQRRAELGQRSSELEQTKAELGRTRAELEAVAQSLSWRLTAPLRAMKRVVSRSARQRT
jgi:hypothetical protein